MKTTTSSAAVPVQARPRHPAPWLWRQHGVAALVLGLLCAVAVALPADYAVLMGHYVMVDENARWARLLLFCAALWLALARRGQPWPHTLICTLMAAGYSGQVVRIVFSDEVAPMPLALALLNLAILGYLGVLTVRPTVQQQLDMERDRSKQLEAVLRLHGVSVPPRGK